MRKDSHNEETIFIHYINYKLSILGLDCALICVVKLNFYNEKTHWDFTSEPSCTH